MGWNEHFHECRRHILSKWSGQQVSFLIHNKENFCINLPWWSQKILQQLYAMGSRLISHEVNSAVGKSKTDEGHYPYQKVVFFKRQCVELPCFHFDLLWSKAMVLKWVSLNRDLNFRKRRGKYAIRTNSDQRWKSVFKILRGPVPCQDENPFASHDQVRDSTSTTGILWGFIYFSMACEEKFCKSSVFSPFPLYQGQDILLCSFLVVFVTDIARQFFWHPLIPLWPQNCYGWSRFFGLFFHHRHKVCLSIFSIILEM